MNVDVLRELEEFRPHLKSLEPLNPECTLIRVVTKEDTVVEVQWTASGLLIQSSSLPMRKQAYDDLGQVLNEVSPLYRDSFMSSLFSRLQEESEDT
jgi:hypothetical protein